MAHNSLAFFEAWLGRAYQLAKADTSHIVVDPTLVDRLDAVTGRLPHLKHVILTSATPDAPRVISNGAIVAVPI
jgi:hypothetical protein